MKNSTVIVKIDLGTVLDETVMSPEDFMDMVEYVDLNSFEIEPCYHILTDLDTGKVSAVQTLASSPVALAL